MSDEEDNKNVVRRAIDEVINGGDLELVDQPSAPGIASAIKAWIGPFRSSFPDVHMETLDLVAEGDKVVGRFACSGTHAGEWRGYPPTRRRFEQVNEVYFFQVRGGKITEAWGLEDTADRLRQFGLPPS